ncbi:MAG: DUF3536 domain-containing protein [Aquificaceae bacterium]|nr:DUF3536 domain-containing protein [Aquificaceae bacterium]
MSILCVHCHFHQPPRENPYLGLVPIEPSAHPYENWNERIFRESYLPNLYAHYRKDGKILKVVNNYQKVSFNFTHSLLSWLIKQKRWFVERIKEAGGNALASGFNHTILPLDPLEDREVQIVWGIRAFQKVFGRKPAGFWLPELAVDKKTLSLLVKHGIKYVILAPHQVKGKGTFLRQRLPEGWIDVFVYDGELSHGIAFGELIKDMEGVIKRTLSRKGITLIAVDGETFGHHKKFGELGLAYLVENHPNIKTLEELYQTMKPEGDGEIVEFTSWSCAHGVERWRSNCGCSTGGMPEWHQNWRAPLREALEMLRSRLKERLFRVLESRTHDPQETLFDFVHVIMEGSKEEYFEKHFREKLTQEDRKFVLKHLYAYKYMNYAFSSDGWFFADISGIEAVKNLLFAKKAMDILGDTSLEKAFIKKLEEAPSNLITYGNGAGVWRELVLPNSVPVDRIITSIALLELSDVIPQEGTLGKYHYRVEGFEPWKVYLIDTETEEIWEKAESLRDTQIDTIPQPMLSWLLNQWALDYLEKEVAFTESYQLSLENLLMQSKGSFFEAGELIKSKVQAYLRAKLYLLLKSLSPVEDIRKIFEQADSLNIHLRDHTVKFWLERYIGEFLRKEPMEEEVKAILLFVRDYNKTVGRIELMVDSWELQNWAWERRDSLSPEIKKLFAVDFTPDHF